MGKERCKMEAPQMPKNKMFLISGNNTGTGILQNIMDANGTGLICETEADTISAAIGSEYGHWSDTLRKHSTTTVCHTTGAPTRNTGK